MPSLRKVEVVSNQVLLIVTAAVLSAQVGIVLLLVVRNGWVERSLARRARDSRLLASVLHDLGADRSAHVRDELSRRPLLQDVRALERWIDLVVERGDDPGWLPAEEYERTGLVERYLVELRTAKKWARRAAAAEILGRTGSPRAVPALLATALDVGGEADSVRAVALRSLARVHHPDAVAPLVAALSTADPWFAPTAAVVLAQIGAPSVESLRRALEDPDRPITSRRWAATILGDIGDRRALGALHTALVDVDPELRARAAKALGKIRDPSSVGSLHDRLLTDPSPFVRTSVAKALGRLPTRDTIEFLTQILSDPEWWVRLRAVESLANLGSPAIDALRGALHDRDAVVAREAARGLELLGAVAEAIDSLGQESYSPESTEFLVQIGRAGSLDALFEALARPESTIVREVVRILGRIANSAAGPPLAALLARTTDDALRARVVDALTKVGARGYVREVSPFLRSGHAWLCATSLLYLERFASPGDLEAVGAMAADPQAQTRRAALRLLRNGRADASHDAAVAKCLNDPDREVRAEAAAVLAAWGRCDLLLAVPRLLDVEPVAKEVIRALDARCGADALRVALAVQPFASERDLPRLTKIVLAVAKRFPQETLLLFEQKLSNRAARWGIAASSLVMAPELPISIEDLVQDEDPRVRSAALAALPFLSTDAGAVRARLFAATRDRSSEVARSAIHALALVPDPAIEVQFENVLRAAEARVVADVFLALALRRRLEERHLALAEPHREDRRVRLAMAAGRAFQGDPDAVLAWLAILRDPASRELFSKWRDGDNPLFSLLVQLAKDTCGPLEQRLFSAESPHEIEMLLIDELESHPSEDVRLLAARGLESLASRKADGVLLSACLRDPSPRVRSAALAYLVERGGAVQRLGLLESALQDPEESVRIAAVRRIATLESSVGIPLLVRHLGSSSPRFIEAVTDGLAACAATAPGPVARAVFAMAETPRLMLGLVAVLRRLTAPPPTDVIQALAHHRWALVRAAAIRSLAPRTDATSAAVHVLRASADVAAEVRLQAVRHLRGREIPFEEMDEQRDAAVVRMLSDPSARVRRRAILVAGILQVEATRPLLRRLVKDAEPTVARAASRALLRFGRRAREGAPA